MKKGGAEDPCSRKMKKKGEPRIREARGRTQPVKANDASDLTQ